MKSSDFDRSDRLSDQIRTEIAEILRNDVKDPRLEGITIIKVELSKDTVSYTHLTLPTKRIV